MKLLNGRGRTKLTRRKFVENCYGIFYNAKWNSFLFFILPFPKGGSTRFYILSLCMRPKASRSSFIIRPQPSLSLSSSSREKLKDFGTKETNFAGCFQPPALIPAAVASLSLTSPSHTCCVTETYVITSLHRGLLGIRLKPPFSLSIPCPGCSLAHIALGNKGIMEPFFRTRVTCLNQEFNEHFLDYCPASLGRENALAAVIYCSCLL